MDYKIMNTFDWDIETRKSKYVYFIETFAPDYKRVNSMGPHWTEGGTLCLDLDLSDAV